MVWIASLRSRLRQNPSLRGAQRRGNPENVGFAEFLDCFAGARNDGNAGARNDGSAGARNDGNAGARNDGNAALAMTVL